MEDKRPKLTHPDNASTSTDNDLHHHPKLLNELKKPQIGAFSVNSSLKDMVKNFLPQIASANEQLEALPTDARQSIVELVDPLEEENERKKKRDEANDGENDDDESEENDEESTFKPYIQMNLALGIFEEKKKQPKMIESLSDNDDEDEDDENKESDENESDENDENRLIIPTGGTNAKELRKQRLAMEREKALDEIMDALLGDSPHLNRMAPQDENGDEESELDRRKKLIEQLLLATTGDDSDDDEDEDSDDNNDGEDENEASEPTEESAEDE